MRKARREFSPEFKREAVALLEGGGRPRMRVAAELGIQPSWLAELAGERARAWSATCLRKSHRHRRAGAEVRVAFIERAMRPPTRSRLMRPAGSRSRPGGHQAWRTRPESPRAVANRQLVGEIRRIEVRHHDRRGSPRMHAALRAEGHRCSRGRARRGPCATTAYGRWPGDGIGPARDVRRHHLSIALSLLARAAS